MSNCPCGSGSTFEACCGPSLGGAPAPTAEALMRSRYTAYVKHDIAHLERSLSPDQRKDFDAAAAKQWAESAEWHGLTIIKTEQGGPDDKLGAVHFSAKFKMEGEEREHLEIALFGRDDGRWVYTGQVDEPDDKLGAVHFSAKFKMEGEEREHLEIALFGRDDGRWVYTGQVDEPGKTVRRETPKIGRNDPCPCGSGKKYKKCCGVAA